MTKPSKTQEVLFSQEFKRPVIITEETLWLLFPLPEGWRVH